MITNAGKDAVAKQIADTATQPAAFNYFALTANSGAPSASDTALTAEIATTGLARKQAVFAHTNGTSTFTLTATFTAVSADVAGGAVVVAKAGVLNASSSGTLGFEALLSATGTFNAVGDAMTLTDTFTLS